MTIKFCKKLSDLSEEKDAGRVYRLPTEAEWEYAARAGTITNEAIGVDNAWGNKGGDNSTTTDPVARQKPNGFGLFDMLGNVWEWVSDCWHDSYAEAPVDGSAWLSVCLSSSRVLRGGAKFSPLFERRSATRINYPPDTRVNSFGFRLARNP
jgi:formylglycine-generating enzyme required for sulfatase activity